MKQIHGIRGSATTPLIYWENCFGITYIEINHHTGIIIYVSCNYFILVIPH